MFRTSVVTPPTALKTPSSPVPQPPPPQLAHLSPLVLPAPALNATSPPAARHCNLRLKRFPHSTSGASFHSPRPTKRSLDPDQTPQISTLAAFQAELTRVLLDEPLEEKADAFFELERSIAKISPSDREQAKASFDTTRRELADRLAEGRFVANLEFINQNIDELKGGDLYQLWQLVHDLPIHKKQKAVADFQSALSTLPARCKSAELQDLERVIAYPTPAAAVLGGVGLTLVSETWLIPQRQIIRETLTAMAAEVVAISPSPVAVSQFPAPSAAAFSTLNAQSDWPRTATDPGATIP